MKNIPFAAALLGAIGVCLGAFGAHALAARLEASAMTSVWNTAVLYHLLHAVTAWVASRESNPGLLRAAVAWICGVLLFSGSLYIIALGGPRWLGPVTPLGGLCFIAGWIMAAMAARKTS